MFFIYKSIQIHFFSSRARADKVNEVAQHYRRQASLLLCLLLPYSLPPFTTWHSFRGIILCCRLIHIWRLVKYAQCLPFCRLCPCQRRHIALMPFKRNTTRITPLSPSTHTHTYTQGYSIEMSSCKMSYGQPCDICARCQLPLMAAHFAPA